MDFYKYKVFVCKILITFVSDFRVLVDLRKKNISFFKPLSGGSVQPNVC